MTAPEGGPDGPGGPERARPEEPRRPDGSARPDHDPQRREVTAWLWRLPVLLAVGGGSWGAYEAIRTHFFKRRPDPTPEFSDGPTVTIAPVGDFEEAWHEEGFTYGDEPAIALRLPGPIPGGLEVDGMYLAAFSRICTHRRCLVSLNRDPEAVAFAFNYRAEGPQLVCRCHLSVFDPVRSGRAVAGPAILPLARLRLDVEDGRLVARGRERVDG